MHKEMASRFSLKSFLIDNIFIFSAVIVILAFYIINPSLLSLYSLQNITLEMAPLLPMALGIAFVLYTGCIDLSIGAVASVTCVITGMYIADVGNIMILYMLLLGVAAGLINGMLVARLKLPSFIVTLCAQSVWRAAAIILSKGGSSSIPLKQRVIVNWASSKFLQFPVMFWIALVIIGLSFFIERKTELGKSIFITGANEKAARLAGVNTVKTKILAYVLCSVGAALGGVMYAYKLKSSVPTIGDNLFMLSISAVALGGTMFSGGRGSALRTLIGVITVISISSGMNMAGVDPLWKDVVFGLVLIFAVVINSEKRGRDLIIK
jgi:ribose/xylose/arabinose/galactoside ABC-type transport system permease subunit